MTGVSVTKNVNPDIKRKLGFQMLGQLSFALGVPYPLPDWYSDLAPMKKTLWKIYSGFGDLMTSLLFASNVIEIFMAYDDIRAFVTCIGTIAYIVCFNIKILIFRKKSKNLEKVIETLHGIAENLNNNPWDDEEFFRMYQKHFKHVLIFGKGKIAAISGGVCILAIFEMVRGYFLNSKEERNLPMYGWYPYDPYSFTNFELSCLFQMVSYQAFLLKDVVVDILFLTILVILNLYLIYLRELLQYIVELKENRIEGNIRSEKNHKLRWWVKHHQLVLKTIEDFKEITNPYLFSKYISVGIILFFGGVLVTSNTEYDLVQQMIVLAINSSNLLQLYIFSVLGDAITENGLRLTEKGLHVDIISNCKEVRTTYLYVATRCSKPVLIHFGRINPLCVASFGQIVKLTFSYFITIVQIRNQATIGQKMQLFNMSMT